MGNWLCDAARPARRNASGCYGGGGVSPLAALGSSLGTLARSVRGKACDDVHFHLLPRLSDRRRNERLETTLGIQDASPW